MKPIDEMTNKEIIQDWTSELFTDHEVQIAISGYSEMVIPEDITIEKMKDYIIECRAKRETNPFYKLLRGSSNETD